LGSRPRFLAEGFTRGANALNFLRLLFALMVIVSHSFPLGFGRDDPHTPSSSVGGIAVTGFFLLSGFLIAQSWTRSASLWRFAWHRFLRIIPGLWICLLVTAFLIGPLIGLSEHVSLQAYFGTVHNGPWTYFPANAAVAIRQIGFDRLLTDVPQPVTINGSLWTLYWECLCYGLIALTGVLGFAGNRRTFVALTTAVWLVCILISVDPAALPMSGSIYGPGTGAFLLLAFLVGVCLHHFAERIRLRATLALPALVVAVGGLLLTGKTGAFLLPVTLGATAYFYFWAAIRGRAIRIGAQRDLSYGVYIYAFPIQQLLAAAGAAALGLVPFIVVSAVATLAVAYGSWTIVESWALSKKNATLRLSEPLAFGRRSI
jgi:peptidoglycan/LPS O-acetylase OafA/YrhL